MEDAAVLHPFYRGKIETTPKCCIRDFQDLGIWYTPGVSKPCLDIQEDPEKVYEFTNKWNTVAVVSDGTRVLGMGDIGPKAGMPVMEGKSLLYKHLGGVDGFPLMVDTKDPDKLIEFVKLVQPGLGGVNLEDIAQPKCFRILDIPSTVELGGTVRALDSEVRSDVLRRLEQIASGVAAAHGAAAQVAIQEGYPVLVNDAHATEVVQAALATGLPEVSLVEQPPEMGVEDFAVLASQVPGCYFCVGAGDRAWEHAFPHHHPSFRIDEQALPIGVAALSHAALALLRDGAGR